MLNIYIWAFNSICCSLLSGVLLGDLLFHHSLIAGLVSLVFSFINGLCLAKLAKEGRK